MGENRPESASDRSKVVSLNPPRSKGNKFDNSSEFAKRSDGFRLAVGIVVYNNPPRELRRLFASVQRAGELCGQVLGGDPCEVGLFLFNNGIPFSLADCGLAAAERFSATENVGFGAGHNRLMQEAFDRGANLYVGVNPDGVMHPRCLAELVKLSQRYDGTALIEAIQAPNEHPKPYDPLTLDTPWISGACFAISPQLFQETNGFDENIFMYCEDVDLSWRRGSWDIVPSCAPPLGSTTTRRTAGPIRSWSTRCCSRAVIWA